MRHPSSFRDPEAYVFTQEGEIFRQLSSSYVPVFEELEKSGLLLELEKDGLIVASKRAAKQERKGEITLQSSKIPFISYPYEWSFSQVKSAALLTLTILEKALDHGFTLKDASAYNVQFIGSKPIFIDVSSFTKRVPDTPWAGYRQFCEHFLGPLALMAHVDVRLHKLFVSNLDGIPLDLVSNLLPARAKLKPGLYLHLVAHAKSQKQHADSPKKLPTIQFSDFRQRAIIDSLRQTVRGLRLPRHIKTEWGDYYAATNYSEKAFSAKGAIIEKFIQKTNSTTIWDLGANTGEFSKIAAALGAYVISFDIDPLAVERNVQQKTDQVLPLILDVTNPSPGIGWMNTERQTISERGEPDLLMALALVHHLAISNNLPLGYIFKYFATLARFIIIEFVPKSDSQVKRLLASRPDIFPEYSEEGFEKAFSEHFTCLEKTVVPQTERILYLLRRR